MHFSELGLAAPLLKAVEGEGYTIPTPIQAQAIPAVMSGADLLGIAQTGTGKTAAFALPILHRLAADRRPAPRKGCRVLVLSPTRELASQIAESFKTYGRHLRITVSVVFGGVGYRPQIQEMSRGVDVLVATPGRLIDHLGEGHINLGMTEIFVLDEADQMLDLGFVKPIRQIVGKLPQKRQSLFFSATMPREIAGLADDLLRSPVKIAVTPVASTAERITQRVIHIEHAKKRALLVELLSDPEMARTLVFARTKRGADRVAKHLEAAGISAASIHGNKSQSQRQAALAAFKTGKVQTLVATDIAARGIDIDGVSHVVNFELPEVPEAYVHRIGRTARAGADGKAISLCDVAERDMLRGIERLTGQSIPSENRRGDASIVADAPGEGSSQQRRGGQRGRPQQQSRNGRDARGEGRNARSPSRDGQGQSRDARGPNRDARNGNGRPAASAQAPRPDRGEQSSSRPRPQARPAWQPEVSEPVGFGKPVAARSEQNNGRPQQGRPARAPEPHNVRKGPAPKSTREALPWIVDGAGQSGRGNRRRDEDRAEQGEANASGRRRRGNGGRPNQGRQAQQSGSPA